jgi:ethanolamine utilization protein EutN
MLQARVIGHAHATLKHASLAGWRLVVVQPLGIKAATEEVLLCLDGLGAAVGDVVVVSSDGAAARQMVGDGQSPARWFVLGLVDAK